MSSHVHAATSPDSSRQRDACIKIAVPPLSLELYRPSAQPTPPEANAIDYMARAQWLRAAILGANDGLVSLASLMMGVGALNEGVRAMIVSGLAGLVAGACSMAIGEYVSVRAQFDIEVAEMKRRGRDGGCKAEEGLPSPLRAAGASALSFALGAALPLFAGGFIRDWGVRVGVVCAVSSVGLAGFGAAGAAVAGAHVGRPALRVLIGGWLAMLVTYGVLRAFGLVFKIKISSA